MSDDKTIGDELEEVHAIEFNGGIMVSKELMEQLKAETSEAKQVGNIFGVKIVSTPYLPMLMKKVKEVTHE